MKHEKFVLEAKHSPSRYYRNPGDVIRDRRLTNQDRLEILDAWERKIHDARAPELPADEAEEGRIDEVRRLRLQVEREQEGKGEDFGPGDTHSRRRSVRDS